MTSPENCPQCGAELPANAPAGPCPACLLSAACGPENEATFAMRGTPSAGPASKRLESSFPCDFGDYHLFGLLGRGGMGAVYEAEQKSTGRRVAVKVLNEAIDSEEMRKRFLREGRLAAAVSHPNSLYLFGTEEIEGSPVIVMEIAGGGTLKDELKRRGPLPVKEAVDAILQIIAGLEAAHAGGVLHRDVKPANCFLAPDGTAKVGDFGLSVSTLAHQDTQLTASGVIMGTPSFAPPEQLKGDEMDVRSDLYSVGATLYTLLTGKAPFDGANAVQVVAAVLDQAPKPPAEIRRDLPTGLSQVVLRCLAKRREARFAGYAALREALLPFSSAVPEPAPPGLRFLAGVIDEMVTVLPEIVIGLLLVGRWNDDFLVQRDWPSFLPVAALFALYFAYYAISEGVWGAGLGKALCGLRVVGRDGARPGLVRASVRAACWLLALFSSSIFAFVTMSGEQYEERLYPAEGGGFGWFLFLTGLFLASWAVLFVPMRRRNGYTALHDLLSGTRVVLRPKTGDRPRIDVPAPSLPPENAGRLGPYRIGDPAVGGWFAGYDEVLRRPVWIRRHDSPVAPVCETRRSVARATRLRWIGGSRSESANWDAYEAPPGRKLSSIEPQSQPWAAVRHWLLDLATELDAAAKDGTLPAKVSLSQVWLTADGRALLLDEPGADPTFELEGDSAAAQGFLHRAAAHALDPKTRPWSARELLQKLAAGAFDRLSFVAGNLQSLLAKPAAVSIKRRAISLILVPGGLMLCFALLWSAIRREEQANDAVWSERHPELPPLSQIMRLASSTNRPVAPSGGWQADSATKHAAEVHLVGHYRHRFEGADDPAGAQAPEQLPSKEDRILLQSIFAKFGPLVPGQLEQADERLKAELPKFLDHEKRSIWISGWMGLRNLLALFAAVQLLTILVLGTTPGQRIFGFTVIDQTGERAGRLRLLGRWVIAWVPFLLLFMKLDVAAFANKALDTPQLVQCWALGIVWGLGVLAAILRPAQGYHDEQVKTWLVPR